MKKKVGVIVGRFQVPELHDGHRYILNCAYDECDIIIIVIGCSNKIDDRNPYKLSHVTSILSKHLPTAYVTKIVDTEGDDIWSNELDKVIMYAHENLKNIHGDDLQYVLYGSRDSFIDKYKGRHYTKLIPPIDSPSGTEIRNKAMRVLVDNKEGTVKSLPDTQRLLIALMYPYNDSKNCIILDYIKDHKGSVMAFTSVYDALIWRDGNHTKEVHPECFNYLTSLKETTICLYENN